MAVSVEARWRRSIMSWRSRWTGVRPPSVRLTSTTTIVGTRKAPEAASASRAGRSASQACSTLATPAAAERRTDSASWAWLMTFTPSSVAVSTTARSSSRVSSGPPLTMRLAASPVVVSIAASEAMTLTTSAPSRTTRRVAVTNAAGSSASRPNW